MSTGLYFTSTNPKNAFQYAFVKQSCLVAPPSLHTLLQRSLGCTLPIDTPNFEVNRITISVEVPQICYLLESSGLQHGFHILYQNQ